LVGLKIASTQKEINFGVSMCPSTLAPRLIAAEQNCTYKYFPVIDLSIFFSSSGVHDATK